MSEVVTMAQIDRATQKFANAHDELSEAVEKLNSEIEPFQAKIAAAREKHLPAIRAAIKVQTQRKIELSTLIQQGFTLFKDPRTIELHCVTVGMRWSNGSIEIEDEDKTVALIEEHLQAMAKILIKTKKTPVKTTIKTLPAEDLRTIGARLVGNGDRVVIEPLTNDDIDQLVEALLKEPAKKSK